MPSRFPFCLRPAVGLVAASLLAMACSGSGALTAPSSSSSTGAGSTKPANATATPGAPTQSSATASPDSPSPASAVARISLDCADHQAAVDKILGPAGGNTPTAMEDRLCQYQQSGNELRITVSEAAAYDHAVKTHDLNIASGSETGPEAVPGVGEKAVAFYRVGRPIAALLATQGGTMVELNWFDGTSGAKKADVTKLFDLARAVLAGN